MIWWKIYYDDGSTYSNRDGDFCSAPGRGVLAIVCEDETHFRAVDLVGLIDYAMMYPVMVKLGRSVPNFIYTPVLNYARHDSDFSPDRIVLEGSDFYIWID